MKFILAKKVNMTQVFAEDGRVIPVTVLQALPTKVSALRTPEKEGYSAVQISSGKAAREFRTEDGDYSVGKEIKVSDFEPGEVVDIKGTSKGRGTAGVMKRHGFHGAPASHGHDHPRAPGSIGQMFPQHVRKGLRMAGRMGNENVTVKNSVIVAVDPEKNLFLVKGGVPGAPNGFLKVSTTGQKKELPKLADFSINAKTAKEDAKTSKNSEESKLE